MKKQVNHYLDILILLAREDVVEDEAAKLRACASNEPPSPAAQKEFRKLLKQHEQKQKQKQKQKHRPHFYGLRTAAVAILVVLSLSFTACMCVPEIREAAWNAICSWYEKHVAVSFEDGPSEAAFVPLSTIEEIHRPSYVPFGYTSTCRQKPFSYNETYYDENNDIRYTFSQYIRETLELEYDAEDATVTELTINGLPAVLITDEDDHYSLCWQDQWHVYNLNGRFSDMEQVIRIAESVAVTLPEINEQ